MSTVLPFRKPSPEPSPEPEPLWREAVGDELRAVRTDRGERLADVAGRAGVSPQYLSEVERGLKDPSSEVLSAVSGALEIPVPVITRRAADRLGPVCLAA
jgi:transcriptional regulator with XRE-family HTH domain